MQSTFLAMENFNVAAFGPFVPLLMFAFSGVVGFCSSYYANLSMV